MLAAASPVTGGRGRPGPAVMCSAAAALMDEGRAASQACWAWRKAVRGSRGRTGGYQAGRQAESPCVRHLHTHVINPLLGLAPEAKRLARCPAGRALPHVHVCRCCVDIHAAATPRTRPRPADCTLLLPAVARPCALLTLVPAGWGVGMQGALLLLLFQMSHFLEDKLTQRATGSMERLFAAVPSQATVVEVMADGVSGAVLRPQMPTARVVRAREVQLGQHTLVKPGEQVPLDGDIVWGTANCSLQVGEAVGGCGGCVSGGSRISSSRWAVVCLHWAVVRGVHMDCWCTSPHPTTPPALPVHVHWPTRHVTSMSCPNPWDRTVVGDRHGW